MVVITERGDVLLSSNGYGPGSYCHVMGRDAAQLSTTCRTAPHNKELSSPNSP